MAGLRHVGAALAVLILAGCDHQTRVSTKAPSSTAAPHGSATASPKPTCIYRDSWVNDYRRDPQGEATPEKAVARWVAFGHQRGYTDLPGPWRRTSNRGTAVDFVSGHATVTAQRVPNGTWLIVSGSRC